MQACKLRKRPGAKDGWSSTQPNWQAGQSMVLVALMMIVFIALLAVTLDGGYAYLQRRNAQTAADAGALAGARVLCLTGDVGLATATAVDYAITRNHAEEADIVITGPEVRVTARIPFDTFFGSVLGRPTITASGEAAAQCFPPSAGEGMLPVAWNCPPTRTYTDSYGRVNCSMDTFDEVGDPTISDLYIIMNSRKVGDDDTDLCMSDGGTVDCDVDDDGEDELLVGGNRSWLDLSGGGGGSAELVDWIRNGFPSGVRMHSWYAGQQGVANNVFIEVSRHLNQRVLLPVYNAISNGIPALPYDPPAVDNVVVTGGVWSDYFHVITFSIFVPTCVHATGGDKDCDLYNFFEGEGVLGPDDKTIEGYFVDGFSGGLGGSGDLIAGAYTLYLTR
jgi:hypothetical protein